MQNQSYNLIRTERRTIGLIVERDGSLTIRAPKRATLANIESFINEKAHWITRTRQRLRSITEIPKKQFVDGEKFLFLGHAYELMLVKPQKPALKFEDRFYLSRTSQKRAESVFTRWYKERAVIVISERVRLFAKQYEFAPRQLKITSAKTRWGSCSPDGGLNFTWRLVMAPLEVVDYVVVHELAHLQVKNHSAKFWRVVEEINPDHKIQRKWLREHGDRLGF